MADDALIAEFHNLQAELERVRANVKRMADELAARYKELTELKYQLQQYEQSKWEGFGRSHDTTVDD
jgi:predicted nuclease with TOPRIM domain